jgi:serine protease
MATPHVVGVAALVKSANPALTNAEIRNILETTAEDLGTAGWDQYFGHGIVDAPAAVLAADNGNQSPTADFTYSANLLTVTFTDQSYDPDGSIVSWDWDFGDGSSSAAQNPVHTYAASGTYAVTLTVTDNETATGNVTKNVTVSDGTEPEIYVFNITQSVTRRGRKYSSTAVITIKDTDGNVTPNATVFITWSGVVAGSYSGVTGAAGTVSFTSARVKPTGPFTITVTGVTHATLDYNQGLNNETTDTAYY